MSAQQARFWTRALKRRQQDEAVAEKTEMPKLPYDPRDFKPSEADWEKIRQLPPARTVAR